MTTVPAGWRQAAFGEFATVEHGWPFRSTDYSTSPEHPVVVAIGNFDYTGGFRFDRSTVKRYAGSYPHSYRLTAGSLLLVMTCQTEGGEILGVPGVVPDDGETYLHNQRIGRVEVVDDEAIDVDFLFHVARSAEFNRQLVVTASGSKILHTSPSRIADVLVSLPPLSEQRAIAEVLGALDDKIAANTRLATTADELVAAMHLRAVGSPGTRVVRLLEALDVRYGEPFSGEQFSEPGVGRPLIRIRDLRTFTSQVWTTEVRAREILIRPGDVVVGMDAEFRPTAWLGEPGVLNQRMCRVTSAGAGPAFVREALREPLADIEGYKSGTTVIHLNKADLERHDILLPSPAALGEFERSAEPVYAQRVASAAERRTLAATRDALLPALMSGALRVRDAERLAERLT